MGLYPEIDRATFAQMTAWWCDPMLPAWLLAEVDDAYSWDEARSVFCTELAFCLAESEEGRGFLTNYFYLSDVAQRCAALISLAHKDHADAAIIAAMIAAFHAQPAKLRITALMGCCALDHYPLPRDEVASLINDADGLLAAWAIVYLSRSNPSMALTLLRRALADPRPLVRECACDEAGDRAFTELTEAIGQLRIDSDANVRKAASINYLILTDTYL